MWDKFKGSDNKIIVKLITVVIIAVVALLTIDVLTGSRDGRTQVLDGDGGTEEKLCYILNDIDGVGEVEVMIEYDGDDEVSGVIVTAEGADSAVVRNDVTRAVSAVFNIPFSNIMVFQKKDGGS